MGTKLLHFSMKKYKIKKTHKFEPYATGVTEGHAEWVRRYRETPLYYIIVILTLRNKFLHLHNIVGLKLDKKNNKFHEQ